MSAGGPPSGFDPVYFDDRSWPQRADVWVARIADPFLAANRDVVRQAVADDESGLRVVVNLGVEALLALLADGGRYRNLYERPEVGGEAREPSKARETVDAMLDLDGEETYFAAVALGGVGIRFYGEYCLVLLLEKVDDDPRLLDRDSYDVLLEPLRAVPDLRDFVRRRLRGRWRRDRRAMVELKVLPEFRGTQRLVTTGTVSEAVLRDQEFIEVHLRPVPPPGVEGGFDRDDVEEIRQSPDEVGVATDLAAREAAGLRLTQVQHEWLLQRESVARAVGRTRLTLRVVTHHGRGYQWT